MKIAVLDLGTNTFNLLIHQIDGDGFSILHKDKIAVKLGEGGINQGIIQPAAFERGLDAIEQHLNTSSQFEVDKVIAFGTSALRSAKNGNEFKASVKQQLNLEIEIIDGNREAELIYKGVKKTGLLSESPCLIMDVGGGSTEFIIGNKSEIFWKRSYPIGAARLLDQFKHEEPILPSEIKNIQNYLNGQFTELEEQVKQFGITKLIGSSGSFETLADIISFEKTDQSIFDSPFTSLEIDLENLLHLFPEILSRNVADRLAMKGMLPLRVDMMVVVCIFIELILKKLNIQTVHLSDFAMKEGMMDELIAQI